MPFEFVVHGTAVSHQAKRSKSRDQWRQRIRDEARKALPDGHFALEEPVTVTIYFFPQAEMQADIDNCAKPILDALSQFIYVDDKQVERMVVQKFEPERPLEIRDEPTGFLAEALDAEDPIVYIKVATDLNGR